MKYGFIKVAAGVPKIRVADTEHNASQIIALAREADALGVKVLALPELCITGYTCGDLFLQDTLLAFAEQALLRILTETADTDVLCAVGLPLRADGKLYNCAALLHRGEIVAMIPKTHLPNYAEFAEARWFTGADEYGRLMPLQLRRADGWVLHTNLGQAILACENLPELKIGVELCEDIFCHDPPSRRLAEAGATLILNLSASTEQVGKTAYRHELIKQQSARLLCGYVYANAGEGESSTDLVFSGHKIIAENGSVLAESRFDTGLLVSEIDVRQLAHARRRMRTYARGQTNGESQKSIPMCGAVCFAQSETVLTRPLAQNPFLPADSNTHAAHFEDILTIQSLGLKQRMEHTGAKRPVIGVSGGLDSTLAMLVAARALDALDLPRKNLLAVTMPCFGTTARTRSNAEALAACLGAETRCVDISESIRRHFADIGHDPNVQNVVFENAQARERTQVLMDLANGCGGLVVGTGDLSELALGWATYSGDHMSMYAVNSGVPKTVIRHLVRYAAESCGDAALSSVLTDILATPVSPELLPAAGGVISQKTEDLVGPYALHDFFLYHLIRQGCAPDKVLHLAKLAFAGVYSEDVIQKWLRTFLQRFFSQQFKRSCLPDGVQVFSLSLSPRGSWQMASDAAPQLWLDMLDGSFLPK